MSIISKKFNSKISSLKSDFSVNKDVVHNGVKGGLNEAGITELIREVIPQRYKITKGIVENNKGEQSNETDIFIYDDEILPAYIKSDLTFVPVEAIKYIFEIKSKLNANELRTTISKFKKFRLIGGTSPSVLFCFSSDIKGSELLRYKNSDADFFTNPAITVFFVSGKGYYYKDTKTIYLKDCLPAEEFMKKISEINGLDPQIAIDKFSDILMTDELLNLMSRSQFAFLIESLILAKSLKKNLNGENLIVNNIEYSDIKFKIHKWIGIEAIDNDLELAFLSGISNTLSKKNFGEYLLSGKNLNFKVFSIYFEDMWGNISCQDFSEEGLKYNTDNISFKFKTSVDSSKIIFEIKDKNTN